MGMQASVAANDGDFVIPTLKPLSRGGSRHSILHSSGHEAAQSRDRRPSEQLSKPIGSRKTSFRLVEESSGRLPEEQSYSPQQQPEQQQSKVLFESQEQAQAGEVTSHSQQEAEAPLQDQVPLNAEAQELSKKQGGNKQCLGQTQSQSLSGASPTKQTQRRAKPVRPIQDWVSSGSKRQSHK